MKESKLGQILVRLNLVSKDHVEKCLEIQRQHYPSTPLGEILVQEGFVDEASINSILGIQQRKLELDAVKPKEQEQADTALDDADLPTLLKAAKDLGASDLHLTSGEPPIVDSASRPRSARVFGSLMAGLSLQPRQPTV